MTLFISDNVTGVCAEIMDAMMAANRGTSDSYGCDEWTSRLQDRFSEVFEKTVSAYPVVSGTVSNALALATLSPSYGKIYCHEKSHINNDECGAPEFFTGGAKLIPLSGRFGKITPDELKKAIRGTGNVHQAQPSVVSLTQGCETGEVYQIDEIRTITEIAHAHGLSVHMDGARFANALTSLNVSAAEMTWKSGVDVLSFGGTKNGCLAAEAVIFFEPSVAKNFPYLYKRSGQMLSKMRFISAQLLAYLEDDLWLRNARHANKMAHALSTGLAAIDDVQLAYKTESNEVFARLTRGAVERLTTNNFSVNEEELDGTAARFVTSWNTKQEDVDALLAALKTKAD
ncbi:threonine aldolase family protein [Pseudomonas serbica]|jgi:threonine aldolase